MLRREFLLTAVSAASAVNVRSQQASAARPNIVFILADDLGYGDLGCYGQSQIETPNLDRMAAEGLRFTDAYGGSAVCAPSRCSFLTGLHTGHCRIRENKSIAGERISLLPEDRTVAEVLKAVGYRTGAIGKWGVGEACTSGTPNKKGFDEWFGFLNQDHALSYYPNHLWRNEREWFPAGNQGMKRQDYVQDLFLNETLGFLRENREHPFFLYLPYTLPHADSELSRDTGDGFVVKDYGPYAQRDWGSADRGYAAMVSRLDADVGRILAELRTLGLDESTLVLFASDNGPSDEGLHKATFFQSAGKVNGVPLKGRKSDLYEGGIRVPAIARWPGTVAAGSINATPWAFMDLLPTFSELAGAPAPEGLDGASITPLLRGGSLPPSRSLYWEMPTKRSQQAIRKGDWKAMRVGAGTTPELYDLAIDPGEQHNLAAAQPVRLRELTQAMDRAHRESSDYQLR